MLDWLSPMNDRQRERGTAMPEIIADIETAVVSPRQHEYYVQVVGEQLSSGVWEAWLEFVPLDAELGVLITPTETTQPTLEDVSHWSETLTSIYLQGAFTRATHASRGRGVVRRYDTTVDDRVVPFD